MSYGFAPLPNKASVLIDAISASQRPQRHHSGQHVRPPRRPRAAWSGTALGFLAALVVTGFWFIA